MMVGRCYQDGVGVEKDEHQAVETYLAAASSHETARLQLGIAYQYGIGVRRNPAEAVYTHTHTHTHTQTHTHTRTHRTY